MLYIIGGSPYSGKSSIAKKLGKLFHLDVIETDRLLETFIKDATSNDIYAYQWKTVDIIKILTKNSHILLDDYVHLQIEAFEHCTNSITDKEDTILEGSLFLPELFPRIKVPYTIIYLLTSEEYYYDNYEKNSYSLDMSVTRNGSLALHNLMKRDMLFRRYLLQGIKHHQLESIVIHKDTDYENAFKQIQDYFFSTKL